MKRQLTPPTCLTCPTREASPFRDLTSDELAELDRCKTSNSYKKNQVVFYENNKPFGVHCIKKGKLKLFKTGSSGREQIVRLAGPGDIIGFKSLISENNYTLSATAIEDCDICFVDRMAFFKLVDESPTLARRLLEATCQELTNEEETICSYAQKSVRERMAETLLILKEKYGRQDEHGGWFLDVSLKREEIAALAGTVLESAVRYLSEFKSDGLIDLKGKSIRILDLEKLIHISGN